jgi:hypothetical protein
LPDLDVHGRKILIREYRLDGRPGRLPDGGRIGSGIGAHPHRQRGLAGPDQLAVGEPGDLDIVECRREQDAGTGW